jgi:hypothetical protein
VRIASDDLRLRYLHVVLFLLVIAQLVKAVKRLAADVAHKRVEVRVVIVQSRLSLVHTGYVAISDKTVALLAHNWPGYAMKWASSELNFSLSSKKSELCSTELNNQVASTSNIG